MAGFFGSTGTNRELGRCRRALYNTYPTTTYFRSEIMGYYGIGGTVSLSSSTAGRYYPYTY